MGSEDNGGQGPTMAEDDSIFDLTLDEVQSQLDSLGKPLSSMNLGELVRTVHGADDDTNSDNVVVAVAQWQPNSHGTLSNDFGNTIVNEVSMDIQQDITPASALPPRRCTLGELTLEDFLAKAGIVSEPQPVQNLVIQQPPFLQCENMVPVFMPSHQSHHITMTSLSSPRSAGTMSDTQSAGRKRVATGDVSDKAAERRRKRMIKNRESAARSRERKQAYKQQLELRLAELEQENEKLKAAEAPRTLPQVTKIQLHRTRSAPPISNPFF